ncbi:MAG TPA: Gfo/Idh/MocA family oxidoreductase [Acidimicrobiia bacterium]
MTIEAVMVGAGQRGHHIYGRWALANSDRLRFVAVADSSEERLARFGEAHGIRDGDRYLVPLAVLGSKRAEAVVIASPDREHHDHVLAALGSGYHVLAEKPMAHTLEGCFDIVAASVRSVGSLHIGHVLRFTPFFQTLHQVIASGRLGDIVTVEHRENVVAWHMAHSYVRGNWSRRETAPPMIVAKATHDFDILHWNLGSSARTVSSIGNLFEFRPERAPVEATERCTDPCPVADCPYDARRIYLNPALTGWPVHVITDDLSAEGRMRALQTGPYGRCAYKCDSDVVDHQVVSVAFESGASASLTVHGHSHEEGRTMRYDGSRATLRGRFGRHQELTIHSHITGQVEEVSIPPVASGHGGGDAGIIEAFLDSIELGKPPSTSASESIESHLLAFLAEEARLERTVIDVATRR